MWVFRQLFDTTSSTYTYLLADAGQALLIDPVFEHVERDLALLGELGLQLLATLDTHVHADHVSAAWRLHQRCGSAIGVSAASGADCGDAAVQRALRHGDTVAFGTRQLQVRATPGHTNGCLSFVLDDQSMAFTGDALLIRGCGRTDFQHGSPQRLFASVQTQILSLPAACLLFPAHDYRGLTVTSVAEERAFNPRLGGQANVDDFTGYMQHLGLPHPRLIEIAVPANLQCGRAADADAAPLAAPAWAALTFTFAGLWAITPAALEEALANNAAAARPLVLDVREAEEFDDALGHIAGARLLPLSTLAQRLGELDPGRPLVAVCRSGTRSAQAAVLLQRAGFGRVANLSGGMLRWRAEGHPGEVAGG